MHKSTVQLLEAIIQFTAERLYRLENALPRDSSEKETVAGLRSLTNVVTVLLEQEHHER